MPENTFDIVSKIDLAEVNNAIQQTRKELITRYDLKNSKSEVDLNEKDHKILLASADEFKLKAVTEILTNASLIDACHPPQKCYHAKAY